MFYRKVWLPAEKKYDVASLQTRDRDEAERRGKELLAAMLQGERPRPDGVITLQELWDRFRREAPSFQDAVESTRKDYTCRANILLGYFGPECDVSALTEHDVKMYQQQRLKGGIVSQTGYRTGPVRARSAAADFVLLNLMLRWAMTVRIGNGRERWLKDNPLYGVRRLREQNPRRPVATVERYEGTRAAMQELAAVATSDAIRVRWTKMELALVLAMMTGRRLSSIRQLRWEDVSFDRSEIRWRAEFDKKRQESVIPIPEGLTEELQAFQSRLNAIGGWVFARPSDGAEPMDRHLFDRWLTVAERHAGLPKLEGGLWHPYRRMWATVRAHLPLKQVAVAGGWKDTETLLVCYQQPDRASLLEVMCNEREVHESAVRG